MKSKKGLEFSISLLVIVVLSISIIILGITLVNSIRVELPPIEKGMPQFFTASVLPEKAETGTLFKLRVETRNNSIVYLMKARITRSNEIIEELQFYDDGSHGDSRSDDGIYTGFFDSKDQKEGMYSVDLIINPGEKEAVYLNVTKFSIFRNQCMPLIYSGDSDDKIDVAILPSGYTDFSKFKNDALRLIDLAGNKNGLLSYEPFKGNRDKFNFYLVNSTEDLECKKNCQNIPSLVCCNDEKVTKAASQCSTDRIFVLIDSKDFCGTASYYAKICNGWNLGEVGTHEFGHAFGGLGDEYDYQKTYPNYKIYNAVYPNCDQKNCPKWKSYWNQCVQGCGMTSYYRPTESGCIMYTYVEQFCPVCQKSLSNLISNYNINQTKELAAPLPESSYVIDLNLNNGKLRDKAVYLSPARSPDRKALRKVDYVAKIISFEGKTLSTFKFELPTLQYPSPPRSPNETAYSPIVQEDVDHTLLAPYYNDAKSIEVYNLQNQKVLSIDVGYLAQNCTQTSCQPYIKGNTCKMTPGICNPYCSDIDPGCKKIDTRIILMVLGTLILLLIIVLAFGKGKK